MMNVEVKHQNPNSKVGAPMSPVHNNQVENRGRIVVPKMWVSASLALSREERMNAKHVELLRKLEQFQLDSPEASLPFSARLARENNWPPAYANRVIAEYKRFAFLAVAA
jgi:hypothetical protein